MKSIIRKFDLLIYRLFRWRWNDKFMNRSSLRKLFLDYLNAWEAIDREPAMGIGSNPPKLKIPTEEIQDEQY